MLQNYLKIAFRNFKNQTLNATINILGLTLGLTCTFLISLWVIDELKMDKYHEEVDSIVQIMEFQYARNEFSASYGTPGILSRNIKKEYPEFEYASNYTWNGDRLFTRNNQSFYQNMLHAENDFFKILSIDFVYGNREELLTRPNTVVISQTMAEKFFGNINPVGETITYNNNLLLTITGVFNEMPRNSTFQFDAVLNYDDWLEEAPWALDWSNTGPYSIAKLASGVDQFELNKKIKGYINTKDVETPNELFVYPFSELYLHGQFENKEVTGGRIDYVRLFILIAIFVLLIACINFMNLSTAKAIKRSKEVGIRKSIGASRSSLMGQFIGESMITSFFALILSIILLEISLPIFNNITDKAITVDYSNPLLFSLFFGIAFITGLISGSYPAFYLSSIEAVKSLKGSLKSSFREVFVRKGLVIFQFSLSIILIISTIIIYRQIQFTQQKNLGYNKENLISFPVQDGIYSSWDTFEEQLQEVPGVASVSRGGSTFLGRSSSTFGIGWENKDPDTRISFERVFTDYDLFETMGFEIVDGRFFSEDFQTESSKIVLNQAAIKVMEMDQPIGETITLGDGSPMEIIGVVKDFNFQNLRVEVTPLFFLLRPDFTWRAYVRVGSSNIATTISTIGDIYKSFNTNYPFDYEFMDEEYASLYRSEMRIGDLAKYFSIFAILISCLGLFGLSSFTAEQRSKEIGVRKVLGASIQSLVFLFSGEFTKLVLIAIGISIPVSWYLMDQWISDFAYNSGIEWWIFLSAGICALFISWLTVGYQSIKAAFSDPVKSLKSE